jgi:hypothetical protein
MLRCCEPVFLPPACAVITLFNPPYLSLTFRQDVIESFDEGLLLGEDTKALLK